MNKQLLVLASLLGLLLSSGQWAHATTYSFNGALYTTFTNFTSCATGPCANFPPGSRLTGQFTTAAPLASNLAAVNILPQITSFSFSDGLNTYSRADPNVRVSDFIVSTDASGNITFADFITFELWQTGSTPHVSGNRLAGFRILNASFGNTAFNNAFCLTVGTSPTGVPDSCTTPPTGDPSSSVAIASSGTWSTNAAAPPAIAKSFGAGSIPLNGSTSLSFTIDNPNSSSLTGVGFTDSLPAGLLVSTPNGLLGSCGGGTITAAAGSGSVSLSGATLGSSGSCTFSVNVTGTTGGTKNNTTGAVTSNEGGTGGTASASVNVSSGAPSPSAATIPTLQEWALWLLGLMLLVIAGFALHRRND